MYILLPILNFSTAFSYQFKATQVEEVHLTVKRNVGKYC